MFGDFEDEGWWLGVQGCRGSQRQPKANWKTQRSPGGRGWYVRERKERDDGFEFWLYFFDLSNNLTEFLS